MVWQPFHFLVEDHALTPGPGGEGHSVNLGRVKDSCRRYLKLTEMGMQRSGAEGRAGIGRTGSV